MLQSVHMHWIYELKLLIFFCMESLCFFQNESGRGVFAFTAEELYTGKVNIVIWRKNCK